MDTIERVDRQVRVIGKIAQKKLSSSKVLVFGVGGLGIEVAKNLILSGIKGIGLFDKQIIEKKDLGTQFFLRERDVGRKTRAQASIQNLKSLNTNCDVIDETTNEDSKIAELIRKYDVVVFTESHIPQLVQMNELCRTSQTFFIACECRGVFGSLFCDFGSNFICNDQNGEKEGSGIIVDITINSENGHAILHTKDKDNVVNPLLSDGDVLRLFGINGIDELCDCERKIMKIDAFTFDVGPLKNRNVKYLGGGRFLQVKQEVKISFRSLKECLDSSSFDDFLTYDWMHMNRPLEILLAFKALSLFVEKFHRLPKTYEKEDAQFFQDIAKEIDNANNTNHYFNKEILGNFSYTCKGTINPMVTFFGGMIAQEAQKAITGKFNPIHQWFNFECCDVLGESMIFNDDHEYSIEKESRFSRYESQIRVFGKSFQERIENLKFFLVGCGALGCEFVKNFAMMGICCGERGKFVITDMDEIETSNLSRQFLFRDEHVGKMKSECAGDAAKGMNPSIQVSALTDRVGFSTEHIFNDSFWEGLDGVVNALDNLEARRYVDSRCVFYRKPLFESGTLGTKCHTQVILPDKTINYSSQQDVEIREFPECTIHVYPNVIEHTISWAKRLFKQKFFSSAEEGNSFLSNPEEYLKEKGFNRLMMENVYELLVIDRPNSFEDCVHWAVNQFFTHFQYNIRNILQKHPKNEQTKSGGLFWTGNKRCPSEIPKFDLSDHFTFEFIRSASLLFASFYGISPPEELQKCLIQYSSTCSIHPYVADSFHEEEEEGEGENEKKLMKDEEKELEEQRKNVEVLNHLQNELRKIMDQREKLPDKLECIEFEKNDDLHISFLTSASNLRARCYSIPEIDEYETKGISGNIVPAMVTTTAIATGLMMMEILKYLNEKKDLAFYRNSTLNIGLPMITMFSPLPPSKNILDTFTVWDRIRIRKPRDITIREFISFIENNSVEGIKVKSIAYQNYILYMGGNNEDITLNQKVKMLTERIMMKRFPASKKMIPYNVLVEHNGVLLDKFVPIVYIVVKSGRKMVKKKRKRSKNPTAKTEILKT